MKDDISILTEFPPFYILKISYFLYIYIMLDEGLVNLAYFDLYSGNDTYIFYLYCFIMINR